MIVCQFIHDVCTCTRCGRRGRRNGENANGAGYGTDHDLSEVQTEKKFTSVVRQSTMIAEDTRRLQRHEENKMFGDSDEESSDSEGPFKSPSGKKMRDSSGPRRRRLEANEGVKEFDSQQNSDDEERTKKKKIRFRVSAPEKGPVMHKSSTEYASRKRKTVGTVENLDQKVEKGNPAHKRKTMFNSEINRLEDPASSSLQRKNFNGKD